MRKPKKYTEIDIYIMRDDETQPSIHVQELMYDKKQRQEFINKIRYESVYINKITGERYELTETEKINMFTTLHAWLRYSTIGLLKHLLLHEIGVLFSIMLMNFGCIMMALCMFKNTSFEAIATIIICALSASLTVPPLNKIVNTCKTLRKEMSK